MKKTAKKIVKHIKNDIKEQKHMMKEDKELLESMVNKKHEQKETKKQEKKEHSKVKSKDKIKKVMAEFKENKLHSGSKKGPVVTNPKQAIAIAYSEKRRASKKKK